MTRLQREELQRHVVQFYIDIAGKKKNVTVEHFLEEKVPRQTIYNIIKKYDEFGRIGDKPRSGRPKKLSQGELTRLKRLFNHKTGAFLRLLGQKFESFIQVFIGISKRWA